jgi:hypothetical protein
MARNGRRSNGAEQLRLEYFSGVALTRANGLHKEISAMTEDSNSIRWNNFFQAACVKLTILSKRRAIEEARF